MSGALAISKFEDVALSLTPEFHLLKTQAIGDAKAITAVTDAASQENATNSASRIKRILADLEKSRTSVKAPVIELGRKIDAMAKDAAASLNTEFLRLDGLIKTHFRAEQEKARKEQEALDNLARKRQERLDAEAAAQEKERLRLEAQAKKTEDPDEAAHLAQQAQEAHEAAERAREKAVAVPAIAPVVAAKAEKMTVRKVWRFAIDDIAKVYAAQPGLVSLEIKTAATNAAIANGLREVPGMRIWEEDDTRIRA